MYLALIANIQCYTTYIIMASEFFHKNRRLHLAHLHGFGGCAMLP